VAEVEMRKDESSESVCHECGHPLRDEDQTLCQACAEKHEEPFWELTVKALAVGGVFAGGLFVVGKSFKRLQRMMGLQSTKKAS
jgi:hypothetical protein